MQIESDSRRVHWKHAQAPSWVIFEPKAEDSDWDVNDFEQNVGIIELFCQYVIQIELYENDINGQCRKEGFELLINAGPCIFREGFVIFFSMEIILIVFELKDRAY